MIVTVGCAEANFLAMQTLLSPGDEVAIRYLENLRGWVTKKPQHTIDVAKTWKEDFHH